MREVVGVRVPVILIIATTRSIRAANLAAPFRVVLNLRLTLVYPFQVTSVVLEVLEPIVMVVINLGTQLNAQIVLLLSVLHCVQNNTVRVSLGLHTVQLRTHQPVHLILFVSTKNFCVLNVQQENMDVTLVYLRQPILLFV